MCKCDTCEREDGLIDWTTLQFAQENYGWSITCPKSGNENINRIQMTYSSINKYGVLSN